MKPSDEARFAAARELERAGRTEEARLAYLALLADAPTHFGALTNLGALLLAAGFSSAARTVYEQAVAHHPDRASGHVNLANILAEADETGRARAHYEAALDREPDLADAHRGLANLLEALGEPETAQRHRDRAYRGRAVTPLPYRGMGPGTPLLLLISALGGNVPTRPLIDDRIFRVSALAAEYADLTALPPHALLFNAVGDADLAGAALDAAERVAASSNAPLINPPAAVRFTGRAETARRLAGIAGLRTPRIVLAEKVRVTPDRLAAHGIVPPLLLRSPGFHTGRHFVRVENPAELEAAAAALPGRALFAIEYLDARGRDGNARKYRVMIVDRRLYPLHLAISRDWKVHYFTADMEASEAHRAEEAAFLADMNAILGERARAALEAAAARLGLDYGGIDFALSPEGDVQVFEANATMVVNPPPAGARWDYRRAAVQRVLDAAGRMLAERAGIVAR
ncbi:MAG TPA: tetratricopeptide repeat protein [Stellaceae bacterium]|nr:tetratricopeptide repeat protein [Stellaceae bacterium]